MHTILRELVISCVQHNICLFASHIPGVKNDWADAISRKKDSYIQKLNPDKQCLRNNPNEMDFGLLGFFAGKVADTSVSISGVAKPDKRSCKSLCAGMGTSGTCAKFDFVDEENNDSEKVDFGKEEMNNIFDELNTTESGDVITLGSPQLGLDELSDLSSMLKGRAFTKNCMIFCPRAIQNQARKLGYTNEIEKAGGEILSDCCTCLTPLINKDETDAVTTNSVKAAYYLKNSTGVDVNLKSLSKIVEEDTK